MRACDVCVRRRSHTDANVAYQDDQGDLVIR